MGRMQASIIWVKEHGLHLRMMLGVVIPIVLVIGTFSMIDYKNRRESALATVSMFSTHIGQVIENDLRYQMLESDFEGLEELLITIGRLNEVYRVNLVDTDGEIIFSSENALVGTRINRDQPECSNCHDFEVADRPTAMVIDLAEGERVFRSAQVINNDVECQKCHKDQGEHLGVLLTDLSFAPYEATILSDLREHVLWWTGALVLSLGVVGLVFNRFVLFRLNLLVSQIASFGKTDRLPRFPEQPGDEIGQISAALNLMASRVETREADNEKLSRNLRRQSEQRGHLLNRLINAQEDERKRVARDLHDDLGQSLSGLALHAQALRRLLDVDPDAAKDQVLEIESQVRDATDRMYAMILDLRPSVLDDLGLVPALRNLAERILEPAGIRFVISTEGSLGRPSAGVETALYRVFQEALTNVLRHARANKVDILLQRSANRIEGKVTDNGIGFNPDGTAPSNNHSRGMGLLGMRERVLQYGGELDVISQPGEGTTVQFRLEVQDE